MQICVYTFAPIHDISLSYNEPRFMFYNSNIKVLSENFALFLQISVFESFFEPK